MACPIWVSNDLFQVAPIVTGIGITTPCEIQGEWRVSDTNVSL